jgi:hypothetical protein
VAPAQTAPAARSHARRATAGVAHRHVTSRHPAQGGHVARRAGAERRVGRSLKAVTVAVGKTLRPAAAPGGYLLLDPPVAAPGAAVSVHGGGFAPGALLHLSVRAPGRPALAAADAVAGPDGSFRATITVPLTQTAPAAELVAQEAHGGGATATLLLRVGQPLAGITPDVVIPGERVSLSVANFRPGEVVHVYAERLADHSILTTVAGGDGRGAWSLAVPYGPGGPNQLVVMGDQGRAPVVAPYLLLNLYPHASVSSYAPQPGQRVTFYGGGFGPQERVELCSVHKQTLPGEWPGV